MVVNRGPSLTNLGVLKLVDLDQSVVFVALIQISSAATGV